MAVLVDTLYGENAVIKILGKYLMKFANNVNTKSLFQKHL